MVDNPTQTTESTSNEASNPSAATTLKAKICLAVCVGLFTVLAIFMLGLDTIIAQIPTLLLSNWREAATILVSFLIFAIIAWGIERHPDLTWKIFSTSILCSIPFFWYAVATVVTNDGNHPVPISLIAAMLTTTVLFSICAATHFGYGWGRSKTQRFLRAFCASNFAALVVAVIPTLNALDKDRRNDITAARTAFGEMHSGEYNVTETDLELSGKKFSCWIENTQARCRFSK